MCNFVNDGERTWITVAGEKVGYYRRRAVWDGFKAVLKQPYQESDILPTEDAAQQWLKDNHR